MSRHRDVRNLNIQAELDDGSFDEGYEVDMTQDQINKMNEGLEQLHRMLGGEAVSGLSDQELKDALWEWYFDVEQTLEWAFAEQERRHQARERKAAKQKEIANKKLAKVKAGGSGSVPSSASSSKAGSPSPSPRIKKPAGGAKMTQSSECQGEDQQVLDLAGLNILSNEPEEPPPKMALAREKVLEQAKQALVAESKHKPVHLVVIGHVDAGKSTLMGRLSYDLGKLDEKTRVSNERQSSKLGKGSFSWAWGFDGTAEERERGITMDIAQKTLATAHRQITVLDAPGHKDFIPNVISGASQADCALLVVDASTGEFEAGFEKGGQTREHLVLVRSVGVSQVVVAINKLDQVDWSQSRYEEICDRLKPFLVQTGFQPSKTKFVPVGALGGVNLVALDSQKAGELSKWYRGPTLVDLLDGFEPPTRDITSPMRIPISNVFRHQVSGRLASGIIQIGEKVRVLPGDETAIIKNIFVDDEPVPWAMAGTSVMISLTNIDPFHLHVGSTLCPPNDLVPLATVFTARIITFEIKVPITPGASVELFHHSHDVPATISKLLHILDKSTGKSLKSNPRVIPRVSSAEIQITLRSSSPVARARPIPIEPFSVNKEMGRILIRQGGETIGAGIILDILT